MSAGFRIPRLEVSDEVRNLLDAWKQAFRDKLHDGHDPVAVSEAMLAVAIRAKVELDGPDHVARMLAMKVSELTGAAAVEGERPYVGPH